ncbi:MAG: hypothetical protein M3P18_07995 [Actinomycetota bacterium]|nr:hypothetical protein [Actinomycetota bacterium]
MSARRSPSRRKLGQRAHELGVAEPFVEYLRSVEGSTVGELRVGEDRDDPDFLCVVDGAARGIEIVDVPMSDEDARALWTAGEAALYDDVRGPIPSVGPAPELLDHPSGDPLVAAMEATMRATIKAYAVQTWLLLNAGGVLWPVHDERDGPRVVAQLTKPAAFRYLDVFVCLKGQSGTSHFFRVP